MMTFVAFVVYPVSAMAQARVKPVCRMAVIANQEGNHITLHTRHT